jgi:hypothetical protein
MKNLKIKFVSLFSILCLLNACDFSYQKKENAKNAQNIDGKYLVDNVYFPQDTLVLKKFRPANSTTTRKLMVELKKDSIYLSNYNFDPWYGKWFCDFYEGSATYKNRVLHIYAKKVHPYFFYNDGDTWQTIEYRLKENSGDKITFIKILDTSNCELFSVLKYLRKKDEFEIQSDIQLK